jgi:hypothetical protein
MPTGKGCWRFSQEVFRTGSGKTAQPPTLNSDMSTTEMDQMRFATGFLVREVKGHGPRGHDTMLAAEVKAKRGDVNVCIGSVVLFVGAQPFLIAVLSISYPDD